MCLHSVHIFHRATSADYKGSGFDRGHLAAAANHKWSQKAMEDTFYLSNVAPQVKTCSSNSCNSWKDNQGWCSVSTRILTSTRIPGTIWKNFVALLPNITWMSTCAQDPCICPGNLRVFISCVGLQLTTCIFLRQQADGKLYVQYQVIGKNHIAVPTHFFKVSPPFWVIWLAVSLGTNPKFASSGTDPGEGWWQWNRTSILCFTKWASGRKDSPGAFLSSYWNDWASIRTPVCP